MRGHLRGVALAAAVTSLAGASLLARDARAGGLYFSERGVRPLARGGAFVAGADDLGALWYNPAGLVDAQGTMMADAAFMLFSADYQRETQVIDGAGAVQTYKYPSVHGDTPPLAIPTLALALPIGSERRLTVGAGVYAPYSPLLQWPETLDDGSPSPSRYSLISLQGSLLAVVEAFAAYKISDEWRIGAGLQLLTGVFQSTVDLGAAPPGVLAAPQDPNYDALSRTRAMIATPSGNLGVTWVPSQYVRFGLAGQLPYWIDAPGSVRVRLPTAAIFDGASQSGEDANVKFRLPGELRAGVEVRPVPQLRVELSYERQFWSLHDTIDITPSGVALVNVTALPSPYYIPKISIQRHFQDTNSVHLGGEYRVVDGESTKVDLRAGFGYESSAIPTEYVSPLTIDGDKFTFAGGVGLTFGRARFDATFAYVYMPDVYVPPGKAALEVINPVQGYPPPPGPPSGTVNGGTYHVTAPIIGLGFQYAFDVAPAAPATKPEPKPEPKPEETKPPPPPEPKVEPEKPKPDAAEEAPPPPPEEKPGKKPHKKKKKKPQHTD